MRISTPLFALLALCALAPAAYGQQPDQEAAPEFRGEQVFEPASPRPAAPKPGDVVNAAGPRIDPASMAASVTNSVVNAGGGWSGSLGPWTTGDAGIDRLIVDAGARHGVDPKLVYSVMHQESRFKSRAVSHAGACGYMQLMPGTARRFGVTDIFDPAQNINAGTRYLRILLDLFDNNVELALAGYNAGEYRVIRDGYRVPRIRETQHYVRTITSKYYGQGGGRRYSVTFGPKKLTQEERAAIAYAAKNTTEDRPASIVTVKDSQGVETVVMWK
jgi:soluble lytic murein transglycosylase-like protein